MPSISELRNKLDLFDDVEIEAFCQDNFQDVYTRFSRGLRKDEKISLLLDYCHRRDKIDKLTILLQIDVENNPEKSNMKKRIIKKTVSENIKVFLNHASEDKLLVRKLYEDLKKIAWINPWLDEKELLPGQDWDYEINNAINDADAVLICISKFSISKIGFVQSEIRKAEEMQKRRPYGYIYMIPVLLEKCQVPGNLSKYHWINISETGKFELLIKSLETLKTLKK